MHSNGERIKKLWNSSAVCHNKLSFYDFSTTEKQQENSFSELKWISNFSLSLLCCVCLLSLASHPAPLQIAPPPKIPLLLSTLHESQCTLLSSKSFIDFHWIFYYHNSPRPRLAALAVERDSPLPLPMLSPCRRRLSTSPQTQNRKKTVRELKHNQKQAEHNSATAKAKSAVIVFFH